MPLPFLAIVRLVAIPVRVPGRAYYLHSFIFNFIWTKLMGIPASQLYSREIVLGANIGAICKEKGQWRWPSGKLTSFPLLFPSIECLCVEKKSSLIFSLRQNLTSKFNLFSVVNALEYCHWIVNVSLHFGSKSHENQFVNRSRQRTTMVGSL